MDIENTTRLLASLHTGRLVIFLGAGLSMAPVSNLPGARAVAEHCYDRYREITGDDPGIALRSDLDALAEFFFAINERRELFLRKLVPWDMFNRQPNVGHEAIADLLLTKAIFAAVSTNYDRLIERSADDMHGEIQVSLDGMEAGEQDSHSPLLKIHGCRNRDSKNTVWARSQILVDPVRTRLERSAAWLNNLAGKDLIFVGFWTDWRYLNSSLETVLGAGQPTSVTVIDLLTDAQLEAKAPALWAVAHRPGIEFYRVIQDGAQALAELRLAFSKGIVRSTMMTGLAAFQARMGKPYNLDEVEFPGLDIQQLYELRKDLEGSSPSEFSKSSSRIDNASIAALMHMLLREKGAVLDRSGYNLGAASIRVVNGAGKALESMREKFDEAPLAIDRNTVVAAGATRLNLPASVVPGATSGSLVRPSHPSRWLDYQEAEAEFGL